MARLEGLFEGFTRGELIKEKKWTQPPGPPLGPDADATLAKTKNPRGEPGGFCFRRLRNLSEYRGAPQSLD